MTETNLADRLESIRGVINEIKGRDIKNVVFLNLDGFTNFVDDSLGREDARLSAELTEVEPYIPLILSDDNLKFFLEAAMSNDARLIADVERAFMNDAKARFINSVYNAEDDAAWAEIVKTCETIRGFRER